MLTSIIHLQIQPEDSDNAVPSDALGEQQSSSGRPLVGLATRLDNRVLDLIAPLNHAIFELHGGVQKLFREFLEQNNFHPINTPKLLGAPSEGGANVFEVKYFEKKGYLAQSPQIYKQMLIASHFERVYEIGDVFRAENSNTSRHLTEYTSLDLEMEFQFDYFEVLYFIRDLMLYILHGLQTRYKEQTEYARKRYPAEPFQIPAKPEDVPILDFADGVKLLAEAGIQLDEKDDINSTQEKQLGEIVKKKYGTDFYILKEYPLDVRAFYSMPSTTPGKSRSYDFMLRGQEVLSGAQRIHNHALLRSEMKRRGLDPDGPGLKEVRYSPYKNFSRFRFTNVPGVCRIFSIRLSAACRGRFWLRADRLQLARAPKCATGKLLPTRSRQVDALKRLKAVEDGVSK